MRISDELAHRIGHELVHRISNEPRMDRFNKSTEISSIPLLQLLFKRVASEPVRQKEQLAHRADTSGFDDLVWLKLCHAAHPHS